jgi:hypothetical protein
VKKIVLRIPEHERNLNTKSRSMTLDRESHEIFCILLFEATRYGPYRELRLLCALCKIARLDLCGGQNALPQERAHAPKGIRSYAHRGPNVEGENAMRKKGGRRRGKEISTTRSAKRHAWMDATLKLN